ncbi:hypothetical protein ElyMa_001041800 [Elysia marginata]|uniref:Uncharacterized protein n=1 Tax=Elysia marginata TaxID=1093978 RepID=A0AAV4HPG3_9GAST|nr:hypothetical protein ElyMa_001041800 [Elysia marginata]
MSRRHSNSCRRASNMAASQRMTSFVSCFQRPCPVGMPRPVVRQLEGGGDRLVSICLTSHQVSEATWRLDIHDLSRIGHSRPFLA